MGGTGLCEASIPGDAHISCRCHQTRPTLTRATVTGALEVTDSRSQSSPEEAAAIAAACRAGATVTELLRDAPGELTAAVQTGTPRPLSVTPRRRDGHQAAHLARPLGRRALQPRRPSITAAVPAGVRVGTVDEIQGQEAAVVFYALTCSTAEDVPRGLDFLFDPNRLNVAISRAQALAIFVHSPRLLDANCPSLATMRLLDEVCSLVEAGGRDNHEGDRHV